MQRCNFGQILNCCCPLQPRKLGIILIVVVPWCAQSPLSRVFLPTWYRNSCTYLINDLRLSFSQVCLSDGAHLWPHCGQFWWSRALTIHLEGCIVHWRGFQMSRLKKSPKISETGQNDVFRPKNATLPTVRRNRKTTFFLLTYLDQ